MSSKANELYYNPPPGGLTKEDVRNLSNPLGRAMVGAPTPSMRTRFQENKAAEFAALREQHERERLAANSRSADYPTAPHPPPSRTWGEFCSGLNCFRKGRTAGRRRRHRNKKGKKTLKRRSRR